MDSLRQRVSMKTPRQHRLLDSLTRKGGTYLPRRNHDLYLLFLVVVLFLVILIASYRYQYLPEPNFASHGNEFSAGNSRKNLKAITDLGIRLATTENNEIRAKNVILQAVEDIKAQASPDVNIEVSVQHPSGQFYLQFLGGLTHVYRNVTNVAVRLSKAGSKTNHALLVNAHFDSAIGSPAASDDAISCATMLEVLRCLSSPPNPSPPEHAIIFLFNGAEENLLLASHGFITQHPWAKQIRAFINLEAAGAGGKELLFQTGPSNPWLAKAYARVAPHPFGSVFGQEVFQSGVIPGDTDFRIFRDYGHIPGIDMAYFVNGYVYHTEYDTENRIPSGSIQRAGENVLALVRELANSPLLPNPGEDKQGKVTYYDILGMFTVVYPERLGIVLNLLTMLVTMVMVWTAAKQNGGVLLLVASIALSFTAILASFAVSLGTALLVHLSGQTLSWYSNPWLLVPLYCIPSLLSMATIHLWWKNEHPTLSQDQMETVSYHAIQTLWTLLLAFTTYLRACSSALPLLSILPLLITRNFLWELIFKPHRLIQKKQILYLFSLLVLYTAGLFLSLTLCMNLTLTVLDLLVPVLGRAGDLPPCDLVAAAICSSFFCITFLHPAVSIVYLASRKLVKLAGVFLSVTWLLTLLAVVCGLFFPYSGGDNPRAKRLYLQHSQRTFHDSDGSVRTTDSCIEIYSLDYRGIEPLVEAVPVFRDARPIECHGLYCGRPFFFPIMHMFRDSWYVPASPPPAKPGKLALVSIKRTVDNRRNFTFRATLPNLGRLYIEPRPGHTLSSWSLEDFVPPLTPYGEGKGCYYVYYTRGTGEWAELEFWLEVEGTATTRDILEIAVVTMYTEPPHSSTSELIALLSSLPDWVTPISWSMTLDQWNF